MYLSIHAECIRNDTLFQIIKQVPSKCLIKRLFYIPNDKTLETQKEEKQLERINKPFNIQYKWTK